MPFGEAAHVGSLNRAYVDEHVFAALVGLNKAVALRRVEPFHNTGRHLDFPCHCERNRVARREPTDRQNGSQGGDHGQAIDVQAGQGPGVPRREVGVEAEMTMTSYYAARPVGGPHRRGPYASSHKPNQLRHARYHARAGAGHNSSGNRRRHSMGMDHLGGYRDWWRDLVVHEAEPRHTALDHLWLTPTGAMADGRWVDARPQMTNG